MAMIVVEDLPVKLLAIAAYGFAFRVEEKIVDDVFVRMCLLEVGRGGNVEGFNNGQWTVDNGQ